jgi:hypothetical protein
MAKVLNKRTHGVPAGAVYVGRPSKFGNPYEIGRDGTREEVIQKYKKWLLYDDSCPVTFADLLQLKGKDLVCWCAPEPCHADVLLKYIPTS